MPSTSITIHWPHGPGTPAAPGTDWLDAARQAGRSIPTGCMGGSCGAWEIGVNGTTVRACIATVPASPSGELRVEQATDPYW